MDDALAMQVLQCMKDLPAHLRSFLLAQRFLLDKVSQVSRSNLLQHNLH